jgi:hypothetical protein
MNLSTNAHLNLIKGIANNLEEKYGDSERTNITALGELTNALHLEIQANQFI